MNQIQQARQTAYKVRILDLNRNEFVQQQGEWEPNYININEKRVSRVNIICTVISKYEPEESNYVSLNLDDGTGSIQAKAWNEDAKHFENVEVGDLVLLIGRVRRYNDLVYLSPEIVKPLKNIEWVKLRKKELEKEYGSVEQKSEPQESQIKEEVIEAQPPKSSQQDRQIVLNSIDKLSSPEGVEIEAVIKEADLPEQEANSIILDLLKEGEIFEIRSGFIKLVE